MLSINHTEIDIKQEVKEELDEGNGVEDFNLDTDDVVDCSQYVKVQINLTT